jgi:guanosine-3',5'-bis(diphosphate) 3'-pyrophosphohydrolase
LKSTAHLLSAIELETSKKLRNAMSQDLITILKAAKFAAEKHRKQLRKGAESTPYINHPLEVARMLAEDGKVEDASIIAAALLHDTIEDTETTEEELLHHFGQEITSMVLEVTDDKSLEKNERKRLQIEHASHKSPGAALIKLADKISNVRDVGGSPPSHWDIQRRVDYLDWASAVVGALPLKDHILLTMFNEAVTQSRNQIEQAK